MTKLYHDPGAQIWVVPGNQAKGAERVNVPNKPEELAHWLNMRRVKPHGEGHLARAIAAATPPGGYIEAAPYRAGDASPPVPPTSEGTPPNARCPGCSRTPRAAELIAQSGDVDAIAGWVLEQPVATLERLFAAIGARVGELRG